MKHLKLTLNIVLLTFFMSVFVTMQAQTKQNLIIESLPENLQDQFSVPINYLGDNLTLKLEKSSVFGENTKFLVDDGTGKLIEIDKGIERTYFGTVAEYPNYTVSAVMTNEGLVASILRPGKPILEITPSSNNKRNHKIFTVEKTHSSHVDCHVKNEPSERLTDLPIGHVSNLNDTKLKQRATESIDSNKKLPAQTTSKSMAASLRPTTVMEVREFEIGVEIGSRAFFANTAYKGNLATAQASAQSIVGNLNARFLRGAGVRHKLGTVIIRTNASTDPLRDKVTGTGASSSSRSSLAAFRDYWNNNPREVGNTHDLAVYHVLSSPSGLAYVNSIGSSNRYATMGGNGATSWADGTAAHEVGHSWSLGHNNNSGIFYEARPRDNAGSTTSGGNNYFISIMNGSGRHNIGRLATNEAKKVINVRKAKSSFGTLINNPGPIPPFGAYDNFTINTPTSPGTFDVIANDYDANNDVLDVRLLDKVSNKGGRISLSVGTGPGGRNQIRYTPPSSGLSGEDFFHYTVFDRSGRTDFGAVYVKAIPSTTINVNINATAYNYDLGTPSSPLQNGWTRISEKTNGDISWSGAVQSRDRGESSGVNTINRDFIQGNARSVLRHKIKNGVWSIVMNLGDANFRHDNMSVKAEGKTIGSNLTNQPKTFPYVRANKVEVRDGVLNIEITDNGGSDPNWVWTRLSLERVGDLPTPPVKVNLNATAYNYDLGTPLSPLQNGWTRISENTNGDISWSGAVESRDRGESSGVNTINRDFIQGNERRVLRHKIKNGLWSIVMNLGDANFRHDNMSVKAEGRTIASNVTSQAKTFSYIIGENVAVRDGVLNIEITDNGGSNPNWVWTRLSLKRIGNLPSTPPVKVNLNATAYNYDLGTPKSPVQRDWTRISENTNGDISWSGAVQSRDRGGSSGVNTVNRDFVLSNARSVLRHKIKNGIWSIVMNLGDANFRHDNMSVKAEGKTIGSNLTNQPKTFPYVRANRVEVRDEVLDIEITDNGGSDTNWVWTRLSLKRVGNLGSSAANASDKDYVDNSGNGEELTTKVKLYPNPVKDILNLSFSEQIGKSKSIIIYNNIGSELKTLKISGEIETIDVSRLPSGIYYLRIIGDNNVTIKNIPFVKE